MYKRSLETAYGKITLTKKRVQSAKYLATLTKSGTQEQFEIGWVTRMDGAKPKDQWVPGIRYEREVTFTQRDFAVLFPDGYTFNSLRWAAIRLAEAWVRLYTFDLFQDEDFLVIPTPTRLDHTYYHVYKDGEVLLKDAPRQNMVEFMWERQEFWDWDGNTPVAVLRDNGFLVEERVDEDGFKKALDRHKDSQHQKRRLFKLMLAEHFGVGEKGWQYDEAFEIAWEYTGCNFGKAQELYGRLVALLNGER